MSARRMTLNPSFDTHDPGHGEPHAKPSPKFLADEERQNTSGEGAQVVYADDDALQGTGWIPKSVAPVFVAYDS